MIREVMSLAGKKFEKTSGVWKLFMEYWAICQKYWEPEENDEYWEALKIELDSFWKRYDDELSVFARGIADVLNNYLAKKRRVCDD